MNEIMVKQARMQKQDLKSPKGELSWPWGTPLGTLNSS